MPAKLPWLSNAGTVIVILKFACGLIAAWLKWPLAGTMYGSAGDTITLLAKMVAGG
jgi:hypothetical protein